MLKIRQPSLETRNQVDLGRFFSDYEALVRKIDEEAARHDIRGETPCGTGNHPCCAQTFKIPFIEVLYVHTRMGWKLTSEQRTAVIDRASAAARTQDQICPLNAGKGCEIFDFRPVRCRTHGTMDFNLDKQEIHPMLRDLSREVFLAFSGEFLEGDRFSFTMAGTVSGKFVQTYFDHMAGSK